MNDRQDHRPKIRIGCRMRELADIVSAMPGCSKSDVHIPPNARPFQLAGDECAYQWAELAHAPNLDSASV
jgi:hypothetical protein